MSKSLVEEIIASRAIPPQLTRMPEGCRLEERTERQTLLEADKPVRNQVRTCGRLVGCTESSQNTEWTCTEWRDV